MRFHIIFFSRFNSSLLVFDPANPPFGQALGQEIHFLINEWRGDVNSSWVPEMLQGKPSHMDKEISQLQLFQITTSMSQTFSYASLIGDVLHFLNTPRLLLIPTRLAHIWLKKLTIGNLIRRRSA